MLRGAKITKVYDRTWADAERFSHGVGFCVMRSVATTPNVFIIESLGFKDEDDGRTEGQFLAHILKLANRKVRYFYIRTRAELEEVLDRFEDSGFRYLHISCHADANGIALTLDNLTIGEIGQTIGSRLDKRRVFFSACGIATPRLAAALLKGTGCYSVIGPSDAISFDEAALYWASLYHFMFRNDAKVIKREDLRRHMKRLSTVFRLGMKFYAASSKSKSGYREIVIKP
jgi:hypothetical protein